MHLKLEQGALDARGGGRIPPRGGAPRWGERAPPTALVHALWDETHTRRRLSCPPLRGCSDGCVSCPFVARLARFRCSFVLVRALIMSCPPPPMAS